MGAQISGIGSNTYTIEGVDKLHGTEFGIGADYIETGSFIGLAAVTRGELLIKNAAPEHLRMVLLTFPVSASSAKCAAMMYSFRRIKRCASKTICTMRCRRLPMAFGPRFPPI